MSSPAAAIRPYLGLRYFEERDAHFELDRCLIHYGNVDRSWFDAMLIRQRLPAAIFVGPPPSEHKSRDLRTIGVPDLDEPEAAVRTFLRGAP